MILREHKPRHVNTVARGKIFAREIDELAFDSLDDLMKSTEGRYSGNCSYDWTGTYSATELERYVLNGWPEIERKMLSMVKDVELPAAMLKPEIEKRRKRKRGDHGDEVDIHQVYQGRVDRAWSRAVQRQNLVVGNKLVHLAVNLCAPSYVDFDDALWRGAVTLRVYEALMRMGRSVMVTVHYPCAGIYADGATGIFSVPVKSYNEPMSVSKLASMVNVGFMRVYLQQRAASSHPTRKKRDGFSIDDYDIVPYSVLKDEESGGQCVRIGACFTKAQAEDVLRKFVAQFQLGETPEALRWIKGGVK